MLVSMSILVLSLSTFVHPGQGIPAVRAIPTVTRDGSRIVAGQGYLEDLGDIKFAHFKGTPWEIGVQHGLVIAATGKASDLRELARRFDLSAQAHRGWDAVEWAFKDFYMNHKLYPTILRNIPAE